MKVEIYSDLVCPWCYIGHRRLGRALSALPDATQVEVAFRPYQLDPGAPEKAMPLADYLERRFGRRLDGVLGRVTAEAQNEGISIAWNRALSANSRMAHRLMDLAEREHGVALQCTLAERLFDLHFTRGGDIADIGQLADAASSVGMNADRVRAYLESDEGVPELETAFDHARRLGIRAVPTFVIDGRSVLQGAQPVATFLEALKAASTTV